jgi:hypothetical protein
MFKRRYVFKDEDKGVRQMDYNLEVNGIEDLQVKLKECSGYLLGVTFLKGGVLTHHYITNNFPNADIESSMLELTKLALPDYKVKFLKKKIDENYNEDKK